MSRNQHADAQGNSRISFEDYAIALVDEQIKQARERLKKPKTNGEQRFS